MDFAVSGVPFIRVTDHFIYPLFLSNNQSLLHFVPRANLPNSKSISIEYFLKRDAFMFCYLKTNKRFTFVPVQLVNYNTSETARHAFRMYLVRSKEVNAQYWKTHVLFFVFLFIMMYCSNGNKSKLNRYFLAKIRRKS